MAKRVAVIASGETERRALPHLVGHLQEQGISLVDVRIPPRGLPLRAEMVEKLIKATWFADSDAPPEKFVVLSIQISQIRRGFWNLSKLI